MIDDNLREDLHRYMAGTFSNIDCRPILINSVEDHIHSLFLLSRTITIADVVKKIKTSSSVWMKDQGSRYSEFAWQGGYGDFGVSASDVDTVRAYIANQREHHRKIFFQDEYRAFLHRHNIEYDERYVWD